MGNDRSMQILGDVYWTKEPPLRAVSAWGWSWSRKEKKVMNREVLRVNRAREGNDYRQGGAEEREERL